MKAVIVTGTPCTGKTTLAKKIAEGAGCEYIDVNRMIKEKGLSEGYDNERECEIADEGKVAKVLEGMISRSEKRLVIDSHLSHHINPDYVSICVVTKTDLKELRKRLEKRGYSKKKIEENMECEIMDVCLNEAAEKGHDIIAVDSGEEADKKKIKEIIKK